MGSQKGLVKPMADRQMQEPGCELWLRKHQRQWLLAAEAMHCGCATPSLAFLLARVLPTPDVGQCHSLQSGQKGECGFI